MNEEQGTERCIVCGNWMDYNYFHEKKMHVMCFKSVEALTKKVEELEKIIEDAEEPTAYLMISEDECKACEKSDKAIGVRCGFHRLIRDSKKEALAAVGEVSVAERVPLSPSSVKEVVPSKTPNPAAKENKKGVR